MKSNRDSINCRLPKHISLQQAWASFFGSPYSKLEIFEIETLEPNPTGILSRSELIRVELESTRIDSKFWTLCRSRPCLLRFSKIELQFNLYMLVS